MSDYPETQGGRLLKRGYTFDPECHRTTYRLQIAKRILADLDITPTFPDHDTKCMLSPDQRGNRVFGYSYNCSCGIGVDPTPTWPEWVTGKSFDLAYQLANEAQTTRGDWNKSQAYAAKRATKI